MTEITYTPEQIWAAYRASAGMVRTASLLPAQLYYRDGALRVSWSHHEGEKTYGFIVVGGYRANAPQDVVICGSAEGNLHVCVRFCLAADLQGLGL